MANDITVRGVILGDSKPSDIAVRGGKVASISPAGRGQTDAGSRDAVIAPPLFDIQVNGAFGIDLQSPDLRAEDVKSLSKKLAEWGVAHWIPTVITNAQASMERTCAVMAAALRDPEVASAVPGIHLEGPYISPEDGPRGAHARVHVRRPNLRELDRLLAAAEGKVLYTTVAPEVPGAVRFIKGAAARGVFVSLGHHGGTAKDIGRAVEAGAVLCTHLGNGLASILHRHKNPLWPQLADDRLIVSLIADLHHLPPEVMKVFVRVKGPGRIVLTSDAVHLAGMKPGGHDLAGMAVELKRNGRICLSGTDLLAGSSLMLIEGVFNAARVTGLTLIEAFEAASSVPARLFGLPWKFRKPRVGETAEFVVATSSRPRRGVQVLASFIGGENRLQRRPACSR